MTQLGHVLAPLDGSQRAETVLPWIPLLPIQRLTLLQVCEADQAALDQAGAYLSEVAARLTLPDNAIDTEVVAGCPAEAIVEAAARTDLLIMSTRGAGGGGRLLFGSVADRVARHAPTPTLLLRGGRAPVSPAAVQRVMVPLDGSAAAERAVPLAALLAQQLHCGMHLARVLETADGQGGDDAGNGQSAYLRAQAAAIAAPELTITTEHRSGEAGGELLQMVRPGDLLVMTTHGQGAARRWQIGSVAEKLLRQASAPVVLVRADSP